MERTRKYIPMLLVCFSVFGASNVDGGDLWDLKAYRDCLQSFVTRRYLGLLPPIELLPAHEPSSPSPLDFSVDFCSSRVDHYRKAVNTSNSMGDKCLDWNGPPYYRSDAIVFAVADDMLSSCKKEMRLFDPIEPVSSLLDNEKVAKLIDRDSLEKRVEEHVNLVDGFARYARDFAKTNGIDSIQWHIISDPYYDKYFLFKYNITAKSVLP